MFDHFFIESFGCKLIHHYKNSDNLTLNEIFSIIYNNKLMVFFYGHKYVVESSVQNNMQKL